MREMKEKEKTFDEIFKENERRIHYHIHKLRIKDPYNEFYVEGIHALWNAYKTFQPEKGTLSTYFNYMMHYRLIDLLEKKTREKKKLEHIVQEERLKYDDGNRMRTAKLPVIDPVGVRVKEMESLLWQEVRKRLTEKQWKWVYHYIILEMPVKAIAAKEGVTVDAVKGWGREARRKLRRDMGTGSLSRKENDEVSANRD